MNRSKLLTLGLLGAFILTACAPNASAPEPTQTIVPESAVSEDTILVPVADVPATLEQPAVDEPLVEPPARGDNLEATDPTMVNIANGEPQLIEFFAFW